MFEIRPPASANEIAQELARGMGVPGLILGLRFGWPRRSSVTFNELFGRYTQRLSRGVSAGRFAPSEPSSPEDGEEGKARVLGNWRTANRELRAVLPRWSEAKLDRYQAPHPALGNLTIREMLYFTLFHNVHHARLVAERMEG